MSTPTRWEWMRAVLSKHGPSTWEEAKEAARVLRVGQRGPCALCGEPPPPEGDLCFEVGGREVCLRCAGILCELSSHFHSGRFILWPNRPPDRKRERSRAPTDTALRIFRRDDFTCRYCLEVGGDLTLDHIDPNGPEEDANYATACRSCNSKKNARTPEEAGMELHE